MKRIIYICLILFAAVACSKSNDGTIIGTASADGGNVVSGITVKLYSEATQLVEETTTDNTGNFSFTGLETGNYYVAGTIVVGSDTWDSGNRPQMVYVSDEIVKEVALSLSMK